jgi:hypothetical protein
MLNDDGAFWLNVTNIGLGVAVFLAVLIVAYGVVWELVLGRRKARKLANLDAELQVKAQNDFAHTLAVPGLGLTMADGGERAKPSPAKLAEKKHR